MTEALAQFHFIRPLALGLLVPVLTIGWVWLRYADPLRGWRRQMDPELLNALAVGADRRERWRKGVVLSAWILAVVVIAGPAWKPEPNPFAEDSSPLIILLKTDASMNHSEVAPSRLERARLKIADLAGTRKDQPLGLIAYAGSAHLVLPPTRDSAAVAQLAAELSPEVMPAPGDHLERAIAKAGDLLARQNSAGSILVITDTVDGDAKALTEAWRAHGAPPVEFLAVNQPGSSEDETLRKAARALNARVEPITTDGTDVAKIQRAAAHAPVARKADAQSDMQWQEGGWYLLPILALAAAGAFRREENRGEAMA